MDEDWLRALSSYQKWKMISGNCVALDVVRSSCQCNRRCESLLAGYRKIREWESRHGGWAPTGAWTARRSSTWASQLCSIRNSFGSMDAIIKPPEDQAGSGDVDSENLTDTAGGSEDLIVTMEAEDANGAQGYKENNCRGGDSEEERKGKRCGREQAARQCSTDACHAQRRAGKITMEAADIRVQQAPS
ncbi:hypothetical protein OPV22_010563 [Ensete ventricosum]|uniref:Uncharacterized protein n=1 Tax=Ensete ventricosum TaxID=4639 RepID=A0AAV8RBL0_ENSVE|nr:hypothetical protein OPV22_010563 [Ensete ventricosum]